MHTKIEILSVNVGGTRVVEWSGRSVETGIFKRPIDAPVRAVGVNLEGDDQADRTVHGGPDKAIYAFPSEHYAAWREWYPDIQFEWGAFGENLSTRGILEEQAVIGALYSCGDLKLRITEPRMPCFKLSIRLQNKTVVKKLLDTGHTGFYFAIDRPGTVQSGDTLVPLSTPENGIPVSVLTDLYRVKQADAATLKKALHAPCVSESWRSWLEERLQKAEN